MLFSNLLKHLDLINTMKELILKHALANAVQFNGKANLGAVLGKVIAEKPELKKDIESLKKDISKIIKQVNAWPLEKQKKELEKIGYEKPEKEQRVGLPPLPAAEDGKVVTRFAPEPNGYLHLGHLKSAFLNFLYARKYKGKFYLRFEDTNPRKEKKEFYEAIREDLKMFGIEYDEEVKESDYMDEFYKNCEDLIKKGFVYVCLCEQEKIGEAREKGEACECRDNSESKNLKLWKQMLKGKFKEGEALARLKTDPVHQNPALREPGLFRIVDVPHPLLGDRYKAYPMYNFACVVMDNILGITHVMRDKGFENDAMIQDVLYDNFGWKVPVVIQFGRIKTAAGIPMKKRRILEMIKRGELTSFEDLRIPNPRNLVKRGFRPEAIRRLMEEIGPSKNDIDISMSTLESYNRRLIDPIAERYFWVAEPVEITLDKIPKSSVKAPLHPERKETRKIPVGRKVFIDKIDFVQHHNKEVRLMHFCNILVNKKAKVTGIKLKDIPKIHWVSKNAAKVKVVMPNGGTIEGLAEPQIKKVKQNNVVQFERLFFARADKAGLFYFAHK